MALETNILTTNVGVVLELLNGKEMDAHIIARDPHLIHEKIHAMNSSDSSGFEKIFRKHMMSALSEKIEFKYREICPITFKLGRSLIFNIRILWLYRFLRALSI
jgi:hypothetical protein